jgi:NitT/TauT family transport system permease protein
MTIRDAAKQTPPELLDSVRSLGAGRAALLWHVVIPAVLPAFFTALRVSLGTAVAVLFLAETFAAQSGLGYLIMDAWARIAYPEMYAAILTLSLLGLILFVLVDVLDRFFCPWVKE